MTTNVRHVAFPTKERLGDVAANMRSVFLRFLELQVPMVLGASVCYLLGRLVPPASGLAEVYHPGTTLFTAGDVFYLTVPVIAWMALRGQAGRPGLEMAVAMLVPVATIIAVGWWEGFDLRLWLITAMYPAMNMGMLIYLLYRRPDAATGNPRGANLPT